MVVFMYMGQRILISEEDKKRIISLYEQRTYAEINYSFIIGKEFPFYSDRKEGKEKPLFLGKIIKVDPKVEGVGNMLPGKAYHEYKIYQFFDIEIISSETKRYKVGNVYRFIYVCEWKSFRQTVDFQTSGQGNYYESLSITKELSPICSDPDLRTNGTIKFPK